MYKTVCFDLGNVLCFFSHPKMFAQVAACSGLSSDEIKTILIDEKIQESYELGRINTKAVFEILKTRAPKTFSFSEFNHAISDIFVPNTELWPTVEHLKNKGFRLILISNTCESHYEWIYSHYPIMSLFDHRVLSFDVGLLKPDPRIFKKAIEFAACAPSECFYTDDIPAFVESARNVGMKSEVFTDVSTLRKHLAL